MAEAPRDGQARFQTQGSTFDTLLAIYTTSADGLVLAAADEDSGGYFTSRVVFNAIEGREYLIAVDGFGGAAGDFLLSWQLASGIVAPAIAVPPVPQTVSTGQVAKIEVLPVESADPIEYRWFLNGRPIPGARSAVYTQSNVQPEHLGDYSVRLFGSDGTSLDSAPVALEIGPDPTIQFARKRGSLTDFVPPPTGFALAALGK